VPGPRTRKHVQYLHHTRDADGDVIFYFVDPQMGDEVRQSSPVVGLRRLPSPVLDVQGSGDLVKYLIATQNTDYEVQLPHQKAAHLALELGLSCPDAPPNFPGRLG
jgi:hypothetical protein